MGNPINKRILLGIGGGIAAYKSAELVRLLRKQGAEVRVVMTAAATEFITPLTLQALSGHPVHTQLLDAATENAMDHISLARWADILLLAPATAHLLAKCSLGLANDLLSTLYLAATCPVVAAPAMNHAMWQKSATQEHVRRLMECGVAFIGPEVGDQACGEHGPGRMTEPAEICQRLFYVGEDLKLQGIKVLISAGPTREPLDPVRFLSNRSSGKMGYALAEAALAAGAEVTLVSGPVHLAPPARAQFIPVETAAQMYQAVLAQAPHHAIYIGAAAVADYSPNPAAEKIKKQDAPMALVLHKTQDILAAVAALEQKPFTVGFAAETQHLDHYAQEKLHQKNLDMIAANWVGRDLGGFDSTQNALRVFWPGGQQDLPMTHKRQLATQLLNLIASRLPALT